MPRTFLVQNHPMAMPTKTLAIKIPMPYSARCSATKRLMMFPIAVIHPKTAPTQSHIHVDRFIPHPPAVWCFTAAQPMQRIRRTFLNSSLCVPRASSRCVTDEVFGVLSLRLRGLCLVLPLFRGRRRFGVRVGERVTAEICRRFFRGISRSESFGSSAILIRR